MGGYGASLGNERLCWTVWGWGAGGTDAKGRDTGLITGCSWQPWCKSGGAQIISFLPAVRNTLIIPFFLLLKSYTVQVECLGFPAIIYSLQNICSQTPAAWEDGLPYRESCCGTSSLQTAGRCHFSADRWQRWWTGSGGVQREEPSATTEYLDDLPLRVLKQCLLLCSERDRCYAWVFLSFSIRFLATCRSI